MKYKEASFIGMAAKYYEENPVLDPILKYLSNFTAQLKRLEFESYTLKDIMLCLPAPSLLSVRYASG